ncbi:D-alanyl-D-alanine carboxypeptidase family protein [Synechococcus sp. CBW1107]|uniref:M15 family metallopeptidase n=1 Tax=Synechococcus sp. CBW1107 TaxID=2789857 RepID=UPI0018CC7D6E|nr:M15 family metallopeptidase [Synechococcus sp. CBW1107]QPN56100.1 D-alanyl-D-alanine carboxypeptidase family protein [Synechococcus sp. CBW1107]
MPPRRPPRLKRGEQREDLPVARRSLPEGRRRRGLLKPVATTTAVLLVLAAGGVLLFLQPLRRWLAPPPVPGLEARQTLDGRLLGHFPYPEAAAGNLKAVAPGLKLRPEAADALLAMQRSASADGVDLRLLSAFRSIELQKGLFFDVKAERNQSAQERAQVSAPPGFSEHSTGYAVDLGDGASPQSNLSEGFDRTAAFRWLEANANRFHFQLSFPRGNSQGVSYEPWHWRYEGSLEALRLFEPVRQLGR